MVAFPTWSQTININRPIEQDEAMTKYLDLIKEFEAHKSALGASWTGINPEYAARMRLQNRFKTGLDIARYTASIMRADMAAYDNQWENYTQSLGCWHGFTAQQMLMAIKRHRKTTKQNYVYLSGWMVAALRSDFGPLPDQSMHEKTAVPNLIEEIYTFLKQADARELRHVFAELDEVRAAGGDESAVIEKLIITKHILSLSLLILTLVLEMKKQHICWQRK